MILNVNAWTNCQLHVLGCFETLRRKNRRWEPHPQSSAGCRQYEHPSRSPDAGFIGFKPANLCIHKRSRETRTNPIGSMYGICTYIWLVFMVNVGIYTIHGWYGNHQTQSTNDFRIIRIRASVNFLLFVSYRKHLETNGCCKSRLNFLCYALVRYQQQELTSKLLTSSDSLHHHLSYVSYPHRGPGFV